MSKEDAKENIENIKKDIKSLIENLSKLKDNSGDMLSDSFEALTSAMSNINSNVKDNIPSKGKLLYKGMDYMYGDSIKKIATIAGVAALVVYLFNR